MFCVSLSLWSSKTEEHLDSISVGPGPHSCFYQLGFGNDVGLFSRLRPKHGMFQHVYHSLANSDSGYCSDSEVLTFCSEY